MFEVVVVVTDGVVVVMTDTLLMGRADGVGVDRCTGCTDWSCVGLVLLARGMLYPCGTIGMGGGRQGLFSSSFSSADFGLGFLFKPKSKPGSLGVASFVVRLDPILLFDDLC